MVSVEEFVNAYLSSSEEVQYQVLNLLVHPDEESLVLGSSDSIPTDFQSYSEFGEMR